MHVVADTDFLSSFFKISRVDLIIDAFDVDRISITQAVFEELAKAPFFNDLARNMERIELVSLNKLPDNIQSTILGKGEIESISYALEKKSLLLTNDKKAGEFAEDLGVKVLDIVSFILLCKEKNLLSTNEIEHIIGPLQKYDYMEFNPEQRKLLLK